MLTKRSADIGVAMLLLAIGIAQFVGGLTMDRLENRHIHPSSFPGLVPMILGAAMAGMAAMLLVGLMRPASPNPSGNPDEDFQRAELLRLALVGGLCLFYALVLVGNLHFWTASSLFIFVFTMIFEPGTPATSRARAVRVAGILVFAVALGGAIAILFEQGFLVRLP